MSDRGASWWRGRRGARRWGSLFAAIGILPGGAALAQQQNPFGFGSGVPWVFQSGFGAVDDEPGFDHHTRVLPLGPGTLHLYATAGPNPSGGQVDVCRPGGETGGGDDVCGLDVQVNVTGPAHIVGFRPAGPPGGTGISFHPSNFSGAPKSLRFNSVRALDPIPAGAFKLGELDVDVTGGQGVAVTVSGNTMVLAGRASAPIQPNIIAVPEPGETWLLASALLGLGGLAARRRQRAR